VYKEVQISKPIREKMRKITKPEELRPGKNRLNRENPWIKLILKSGGERLPCPQGLLGGTF